MATKYTTMNEKAENVPKTLKKSLNNYEVIILFHYTELICILLNIRCVYPDKCVEIFLISSHYHLWAFH